MLDCMQNTLPRHQAMPLGAVRCQAVAAEEVAAEPVPPVGQALPVEAEFILSALEAAGHRRQGLASRRQFDRVPYHAIVHLHLFSDRPGARPWVLFARDVSIQSLGFVARDRLPLGYGGSVVLRTPDGREIRADCVLQRCRETVSGWFEGSLAFNRPQRALEK